eukprot:g3794.t1
MEALLGDYLNFELLEHYNTIFGVVIGILYLSLIYLYTVVEHACYTPPNKEVLEPKPGPLWKVMVSYVLIKFSKLVRPRQSNINDENWLEGRHYDNSSSEHYNDSFYWWCNTPPNDNCQICVTTRLGFHGKNASKVTPWLVFDIDGETFSIPTEFVKRSIPGKINIFASDSHGNKLEYTCTKPMERWNLNYNGMVRIHSTNKQIKASLNLNVKVIHPAFYYQKDWDQMTVAKAMSSKPWSIEFFQNLKSEHQEHYEMGLLVNGTIHLDNGNDEELKQYTLNNIPGFRDHSFGKRKWTNMSRYIWLGTVSFDKPIYINGNPYTHMSGTAVHYGTSFKHMVAGGLMGPSASQPIIPFNGMSHMKDIAPEWYKAEKNIGHGIGHLVPNELRFSISLKGVDEYLEIHVQRDQWTHGFLMQDETFEVHEGTSLYTIQHGTDGDVVQGHGLLEFGGTLFNEA